MTSGSGTDARSGGSPRRARNGAEPVGGKRLADLPS